MTSGAWREAVVCVRDLGRWLDALDHLFGWRILRHGPVDPSLLAAWGLPASASGEEALLVEPSDGTDTAIAGGTQRCVRMMELQGVPQVEIRSSGNHWDTGGIFSLLAYARDVDATFAAAQRLGWSAFHDPVDMHFGERVLRNVVLRGWDGVNFGLYRVLSPTPPEPAYTRVGMAFNGQQSVRAIGPARDFYSRVLGWTAWFDGVTHMTCNNFGMPENFVGKLPKNVIISAGGKSADGTWAPGQVELVEWVGFSGRDFAERAVPPNLGIVALRIPVVDVPAHCAQLVARGGTLHAPPARVHLDPWGEVVLASTRSPDGALIEFIAAA